MTASAREMLMEWVVEALNAHHGRASILQLSKHVWEHHERDLRNSGDLFFTWQYDIRWAGKKLRDQGVLKPVFGDRNQPWELLRRA